MKKEISLAPTFSVVAKKLKYVTLVWWTGMHVGYASAIYQGKANNLSFRGVGWCAKTDATSIIPSRCKMRDREIFFMLLGASASDAEFAWTQ